MQNFWAGSSQSLDSKSNQICWSSDLSSDTVEFNHLFIESTIL